MEAKRKWRHPGGKLRELGAHTLTDAELLAILISSGIKGKSAEEVLERFGPSKEELRRLAELGRACTQKGPSG